MEIITSLKSQNSWWEEGIIDEELIGIKREISLIEFLDIREIKLITLHMVQ